MSLNDFFQAVVSPRHPMKGMTVSSDKTATSGQMICVAVIDSHQLSRECLIGAAFTMQPFIVFTPFPSVSDFAASFTPATDLVVYVHHSGGPNAIEDLSFVLRYVPSRRLIVVSDSSSEDGGRLLHEFESRSAAVIQARKSSLQMTISTFYLVHHGRLNLPLSHAEPWDGLRDNAANQESLSPPPPHDAGSLTRRERMVLDHIAKGQSNKEIAVALQMSISTVKAHVRSIMQKSATTNRVQLALNAQRRTAQRP